MTTTDQMLAILTEGRMSIAGYKFVDHSEVSMYVLLTSEKVGATTAHRSL